MEPDTAAKPAVGVQELPLETGVEADEPFKIETHGINTIPLPDRHGHPRELFWVWLGANLIFTYVIVGGVIMGFGLGFWPAVVAVLIGNLFYFLLGVGALSGPKAGTATIVVSRAPFGVFGNAPAAFLSWITVVGWQAVNIVIGTLVLFELAVQAGLPAGNGLIAICLALLMIVTYLVAVWGHATIVVMNTVLSVLLAIGTAGLAVFVLPQVDVSFAGSLEGAGIGPWLLALMVVAAAPFSWMNYPADYSRYLPPETPGKPIILYTAVGAVIPAILIALVGVAAGTVADMTDPVAGIAGLVPGWFLTLYFLVIIGGTITNNFLNTYSSGLNLQAVGVKLRRHHAVLVDAVIAGVMSVYALFVFNFVDSFIQFLSLMIIWIAPWTAIYLTDMYLRRNSYEPEALHRFGEGPYWYSGGWNWPAIVAFGVGAVAAALFANAPIWQGPLVGLVGGGDNSILSGFVAAGILYYLAMRNRHTVRTSAGAETETAVR